MEQFEHLKIQLEAIKLATNNFASENCIGKGGFGKVYMGQISHFEGNTMVAFKRLDRAFGQGDSEFWREVMMLSLYKHENIVSLLGYCDDCGEKILVYQYASKRSLELYINNHELTWVRRLHICIGAARGLAYLHSAPIGTQQRLLHRDIKSSNILLDENWNAKISDFGLSKICPANQKYTFLFSHPMGTPGYCDPLYAKTGYLTKESDVYSFGVVLFEVLCGRLSIGNNIDERQPLVELVRQCYKENKLNEIIFGNIKHEINPDSLKVFTRIAYQCLMKKREERPLMTYIVTALESALEYQCPKPPSVGILNVKVLRGMNLKRRSFVGAFNPYVVLKLIKSGFPCAKKTTVKHDNVKPEWNEEFTFYVENFDVQSLEIWVGNAVTVEMHDNLRIALLPLKDLTPEIPKARDFYIFNPRYNNRVVGNLKVEVEYIPFTNNQILTDNEDINAIPKAPVGTPEGGGLLVVIIHEGRFLQDENHTVWLLFQGESRKTRTMMNTRYPLWEEEFTFMLNLPPTNEILHLDVINSSWTGNESLGCVDISLADVVSNNRTINTYKVHSETRLIVELQWRTTN